MGFKIIIFLSLMLISLVSANGLNTNSDSYEINKTYQEDKYINILIKNEESFNFYNISADKLLIFDKFNLNSGENKTISIKITSDDSFNGQIRIQGDYYAVLGASNNTETVQLTSSGLDICDLNLIQGDSVIWKNTLSGEIKLRNLKTGQYFETISGSSEKKLLFDSPLEFDYQVYKVGLPFSQVCHLNIMATEGFVHNSEYDKLINLNLTVIYPETTISAQFLTDNFTIEYSNELQDIFKITNTGTKIAKEIKLTADWINFGKNNFDLNAGDSINIPYTIIPLIFNTNQTNQTYQKTIRIEGNFPTLEKNISITIPYREILSLGSGNLSLDKEALLNYQKLICLTYPDDCYKKIVYANESDRNVTFNIGEEAYREGLIEDDLFREEIRSYFNTLSEKVAIIENKTGSFENLANQTSNDLQGIKESNEGVLSVVIFIGLFFLGGIAISILLILIFSPNLRNKFTNIAGYHKGEKRY